MCHHVGSTLPPKNPLSVRLSAALSSTLQKMQSESFQQKPVRPQLDEQRPGLFTVCFMWCYYAAPPLSALLGAGGSEESCSVYENS